MIIQEVQFTKTDKQGKESQVKVMLGYCFATEILFNEMAGEEVGTFVKEAIIATNLAPPSAPSLACTSR